VSIEAREDLLNLAVEHKLADCKTCQSGLYMAIVRIYGHYVEDMNEIRLAKEAEPKIEEKSEPKIVKTTKTKKTRK